MASENLKHAIALSNSGPGESCNVCVNGITTVLCNTTVSTSDTANIATNIGSPGFVGPSGYIFHPNQLPSIMVGPVSINTDYIRAGFFLEAGAFVANNNTYALFNVNIKHTAF